MTVWAWIDRGATLAGIASLIVGVVFAGVQFRQAADMQRENLAFQAELTVLDAQQRISDAILAVVELDLAARSADNATRDAAIASLRVAVARLDALIFGMNDAARARAFMREIWHPVFMDLCDQLRSAGYLASNASGAALDRSQEACNA